jgi:hypothetical protein
VPIYAVSRREIPTIAPTETPPEISVYT